MNGKHFLLGFAICVFSCTVSLAASFDCKKASNSTEKAICSNYLLSELDNLEVQTHKKAFSNVPKPDIVKWEQQEWIKELDQCIDNVDCIKHEYDIRIAELHDRIAQNAIHKVYPPSVYDHSGVYKLVMLFTSVIVVLKLVLLVATISPLLVMPRKNIYSATEACNAKWHSYFLILPVIVISSNLIGISFHSNTCNYIVLVSAYICIFALVIFSVKLKPSICGAIIGTLSFATFFLYVLASILYASSSKSITAEIGDSIYCKQSIVGIWYSAVDSDTSAFKKYIFFDKRIAREIGDEIADREHRQLSGDKQIIDSCYEAFERKRLKEHQ